jgi:lysophospholipase L1-like esterase
MPKLFVVGDSISIQYGPYLAAMLPTGWDYARKGDSEAANGLDEAANGGDSSMVLIYLRQKLQDPGFKADYVLLNCGLHDIKTDPHRHTRQVEADQYAQNLPQILALIQAQGSQPIWVRTTPVDDQTHNSRSTAFHRFNQDVLAYNAIADAVFEAANVPIIDLYHFTQTLPDDLYCDHVHFTETVRAKQAAYIAGFVSALS